MADYVVSTGQSYSKENAQYLENISVEIIWGENR
jgi:hypothetical protein